MKILSRKIIRRCASRHVHTLTCGQDGNVRNYVSYDRYKRPRSLID